MSPFARQLHELRMRHGIRQNELAELIGYDQTYISALEVGLKGPPTIEFVNKLVRTLSLTSSEECELRVAAKASERKLVLEPDAHPDVYWMLDALRQRLDGLHPAQARLIRELLNLPDIVRRQELEPTQRLRRRRNLEAQM
ncbi:helix-turn-helix transcriptional regulator [Comamonas sp. Z1]|uniref:helix-turn-helix domain-containing protein n=1 Tax=Comamonas sp. Z1 TaxID=2601246 RepID=UPI0011E8850F|nr:helix-turn-helix domain-containing protein [Comamonas sp. Z1]TYK72029.1 helix-turn-helix transcriptional regulator [Comamonas sp. Z1]